MGDGDERPGAPSAVAPTTTQSQHWHGLPEDARSILDQRLARGEISAEEYARLRETLETGRPRTPVG